MKYTRLFLLLVLVATLASCINGPPQVVNEPRDRTTLIVWHNWPYPESTIIDEILERFVEASPNIHIISEYVPSKEISDRFISQASLGLAPDILIGEELFLLHELTDRNLLQDLSPLNIDTSELPSRAVDAVKLGDAQYGIPFTAYTNILFYNTDLVEEPATTLDELLDAARSGQKLALSTDFYHAYWGIRAFGGTVFDESGEVYNDPAFVSWLNWLTAAQKEPTILFNTIYDELYQEFTLGDTAYFVGNSFDLPYLQEELGEDLVGVALLPGIERAAGSFLEIETIAVSKQSANLDKAADLISFFINPAQQRRIALSNFGQIPLNNRTFFNRKLAPIPTTLITQRNLSTIVPLEHVVTEDILRTEGTDIYRQVLGGILTPEEGVESLVERIESGEAVENIAELLLTQFHDVERAEIDSEPSDINLFFDVFRKIQAYAQRPVFQRQLLAVAAILASSIFIAALFWRTFGRVIERNALSLTPKRFKPVTAFLLHLIRAVTFPILGLLVIELTRRWFNARGMTDGTLIRYEQLFSLLIIYQFTVAIFYEIFEDGLARRLHYTFLLPALLTITALAALNDFVVVTDVASVILTRIFNSPLTIQAVFFSTIGLYLWIGLVRSLQNVFQWLLNRITSYDPGEIESTLTLIRYLLVIFGFGYVFSLFNFDSTTTAAITGGLSVGVGFGLQQILANFISGLLMLFERSLHTGDVIEVDDQLSVVQDFSIRATRVRTRNNEELLIPNQTFFTSSFKTYTGTDSKVRISLTVQTDCAIEPTEVIALLRETALAQPDVLNDPVPTIFLLDYGNNVATFQLNVWIVEPMLRYVIMSEIKIAVWGALKEHNVALPFPEMELLFPKPVPSVGAYKVEQVKSKTKT